MPQKPRKENVLNGALHLQRKQKGEDRTNLSTGRLGSNVLRGRASMQGGGRDHIVGRE